MIIRLLSSLFISFIIVSLWTNYIYGDVVSPPPRIPNSGKLSATLLLNNKEWNKIIFRVHISGPCNYSYSIINKHDGKIIATGKGSYKDYYSGYINIYELNINNQENFEKKFVVNCSFTFFKYDRVVSTYTERVENHPIYHTPFERTKYQYNLIIKDKNWKTIDFNHDVYISISGLEDKNNIKAKIDGREIRWQ